MPTATMTSKGQITIPAKIRAAPGLKPGTRIDFHDRGDGEYVLRPKTASIRDLEGCISYDGPPVNIEQMNLGVLDRAAELDRATRSDAPNDRSSEEAA